MVLPPLADMFAKNVFLDGSPEKFPESLKVGFTTVYNFYNKIKQQLTPKPFKQCFTECLMYRVYPEKGSLSYMCTQG